MSGESLFDSAPWRATLAAGLGASTIDISGPSGASLPWTLVSRGPITAAFPRFPVGLESADAWFLADPASVMVELRARGVDIVRMSAPATAFAQRSLAAPIDAKLPETCIDNLAAWRAENVAKSVRRKFRQALSGGLVMKPVEVGDDSALHAMYLRAVQRQQGQAKYPLAYFQALCRAAQGMALLSAGKAVTSDGAVAAFVIVGHDADTSYYLHGGYHDRHSTLRPGYFAMRWALETARDRGSKRFNFLVSPANQSALRAYKESFGGSSSERWHWQQPLTLAGRAAIFTLGVADRTRGLFRRVR